MHASASVWYSQEMHPNFEPTVGHFLGVWGFGEPGNSTNEIVIQFYTPPGKCGRGFPGPGAITKNTIYDIRGGGGYMRAELRDFSFFGAGLRD